MDHESRLTSPMKHVGSKRIQTSVAPQRVLCSCLVHAGFFHYLEEKELEVDESVANSAVVAEIVGATIMVVEEEEEGEEVSAIVEKDKGEREV